VTTPPVDAAALPAERLTAHQPPALLVERVVTLAADGGSVRLKAHQGLDALQLLEGGAQAIAVLMGARMRRDGIGASASGMLVGAKDLVVTRPALAGESVVIRARCTHELGPLQLHEVVASSEADGSELMRGELKVAATVGDAA
jgi:predicted hotdog family 3-hydroxylacyl-ACP dehydratase